MSSNKPAVALAVAVRAVQSVVLTVVLAASPALNRADAETPKRVPSTVGCNPEHFIVAIDVGHSAAAPGALSSRLVTEYSYNLKLAIAIREALVSRGFVNAKVLVSPTSDLASRPARAAALHSDAFIAIHHDSVQPRYLSSWTTDDGRTAKYSDRFRGYSVFYAENDGLGAKSLALARLVAGQMKASGVPFSPHHAEDVPGERRLIVDPVNGVYRYDGLVVLKRASMPAVLLEAGVIVNRQEELEVASESRRWNTANAVANAFSKFCAALDAK
jgi:N-acetylmuramoyl-L-alanine amidase